MRLVMTLVVRDEADILETNLRVHRALGVDAFAVLDNGSTDGSAEILGRWERAGLARVITDPDADTDEIFLEWQTRLAHLATTELDADWIINNDGDEFWLPVQGSLADVFTAQPADVHGVLAPRLEFVPVADGSAPFWERMTLRERHTRVLPKIAHRAALDVRVGPGSHHVSSPSLGLEATAGKPSLRGLRQRAPQPHLIAPAADFPCVIFHLPLRSFEQFRSRLGIGLRIAATRESPELESAIKEVIAPEEASRRWAELIAAGEAGLAAGTNVNDTRLRDLIRAIGPPEGEPVEPPRHAVPPQATDLDAAQDEATREALAGLVYNHAQTLAERDAAVTALGRSRKRLSAMREQSQTKLKAKGELLQASRKQAKALERRLSEIETSRWRRLLRRRPRR